MVKYWKNPEQLKSKGPSLEEGMSDQLIQALENQLRSAVIERDTLRQQNERLKEGLEWALPWVAKYRQVGLETVPTLMKEWMEAKLLLKQLNGEGS